MCGKNNRKKLKLQPRRLTLETINFYGSLWILEVLQIQYAISFREVKATLFFLIIWKAFREKKRKVDDESISLCIQIRRWNISPVSQRRRRRSLWNVFQLNFYEKLFRLVNSPSKSRGWNIEAITNIYLDLISFE